MYTDSFIVVSIIPKSVKCIHSATKVLEVYRLLGLLGGRGRFGFTVLESRTGGIHGLWTSGVGGWVLPPP